MNVKLKDLSLHIESNQNSRIFYFRLTLTFDVRTIVLSSAEEAQNRIN